MSPKATTLFQVNPTAPRLTLGGADPRAASERCGAVRPYRLIEGNLAGTWRPARTEPEAAP